jgi:hypothetical protein
MRVGDFGVEVLAVRDDDIRELDTGHVLARPGAVYALRLRNFGPLRCVANVEIDAKAVTAGGLVLDAYSAVTLERPVDEFENGRFTVVAEGNERVFGPDGGRDNDDLGLIEARFRRELPDSTRPQNVRPLPETPSLPFPSITPPSRPMAPSEWSPFGRRASPPDPRHTDVSAIARSYTTRGFPASAPPSELVERAAGTGLTGRSNQRFESVFVGKLEQEATVLQLRLVIGTDEAFSEPRPLRQTDNAPARPAARP